MKYKLVISIFLIIFFNKSFSISGKIIDETGKGISDVIITSNEKGTISNKEGKYYINIANYQDSLLFHKLGFETIKMKIKDVPNVLILKRKSLLMDEFVVMEKMEKFQELISPNKKVIKIGENEQNLSNIIINNSNVFVKGSGLSGEKQEISILGHKSKHTLILLDGIPLNSNGMAFDLSLIPASSIEKIEILQNNASALTGAGSIGGVINLITKSTDRNLSNERKVIGSYLHRFGSFGYSKNQINIKYNKSDFHTKLSVEKLFTRNDFKYKYLFSNDDSMKIRTNNSKEIYNVFWKTDFIHSKFLIDYTFTFQDFYKELPGQTNQLSMFDRSNLTGFNHKHIVTFEKKILINLNSVTDFFYFQDYSIYDNTKSSLPTYRIKGKTKHSKAGFHSKLNYNFDDYNLLNFGFNFHQENFSYLHFDKKDEELESVSIKPVFQRNVSGFLESKFEQQIFPINFTESIFLRFDKNKRSDQSNFTDKPSWRIDLQAKYDGIVQNTLGVILANAYSLPSFYDLYWKGGQQAKGNPDLSAELSKSLEVSYKICYLQNNIKVAYHKSIINDLIFWKRSVYYWQPDNLGKAKIDNFTVESEMKLFKFAKISFFWVRTLALDKTNSASNFYEKHLIYTPRSQLNSSLELDFFQINLLFQYKRTGRQWSTQDNLFPYLDAYETVAANISYLLNFKKIELKLYIQGTNIFDTHYDIYSNIPKPGFHWNCGFEVKN